MADVFTLPLDDAGRLAKDTIRIPAGVMGMLQQSYSTRERQLDWLLAIVAVGATMYAFWDQIAGACGYAGKVGAGTEIPDHRPNEDVTSALPRDPSAKLYNYNMPASRNMAWRRGPSMNPIPNNPSFTPAYPVDPTEF